MKNRLADMTFEDLPRLWEEEAKAFTAKDHPKHALRYDKTRASRAKTNLPAGIVLLGASDADAAFATIDPDALSKLPLTAVLKFGPGEAAKAAAAFSTARKFGIGFTDARLGRHQSGRAIQDDSGEQVRIACEACMNLLYELSNVDVPRTASKWKDAPPGPEARPWRHMYNFIRRWHEAKDILDPADATSLTVQQAIGPFRQECARKQKSGVFNGYVHALGGAIDSGIVNGLSIASLATITDIKLAPERRPTMKLTDAELIRIAPAHFFPEDEAPTRISRERGLLGFFHKEQSVSAENPNGSVCKQKNRLHEISLDQRQDALSRFLGRNLENYANRAIEDILNPTVLWEDLQNEVRIHGAVTRGIQSDFFHVYCTLKHYLKLDVQDLDGLMKERITWPSPQNTVGHLIMETGSVETLFAQLEALRAFAVEAPLLMQSTGKRAGRDHGRAIPRWSAAVFRALSMETVDRPLPLERLEVVDGPRSSFRIPVLWQEADGTFMARVPPDYHKHNMRKIFGSVRVTVADANRYDRGCPHGEPTLYQIRNPRLVEVIHKYLHEVRCHAHGVRTEKTRRLLLNQHGMPYGDRAYSSAFQQVVRQAAEWHFQITGEQIQLHLRYAARHIISTALDEYDPGRGLKTIALTHRAGTKTDALYGRESMARYRSALDAVLEGRPPLAVQEAQLREEDRKSRDTLLQELQELRRENRQMQDKLLELAMQR